MAGEGSAIPRWLLVTPSVPPTSRKCCSAGGVAEGTSEHAASTGGLQTCLQVRYFPPALSKLL